jgi:hypothetical protein
MGSGILWARSSALRGEGFAVDATVIEANASRPACGPVSSRGALHHKAQAGAPIGCPKVDGRRPWIDVRALNGPRNTGQPLEFQAGCSDIFGAGKRRADRLDRQGFCRQCRRHQGRRRCGAAHNAPHWHDLAGDRRGRPYEICRFLPASRWRFSRRSTPTTIPTTCAPSTRDIPRTGTASGTETPQTAADVLTAYPSG